MTENLVLAVVFGGATSQIRTRIDQVPTTLLQYTYRFRS